MNTKNPDWYQTAETAHTEFERRVTAIRADQRLSREGKQAQVARAWTAMRAKIERSMAEAQQHDADEQRRLERRLFSVGSHDPAAVLAARDAHARAMATEDPDGAMALLVQAQRTGDAPLGRALLNVAVDRYRLHPGWRTLAQAWAEENPTYRDDVEAYIGTRTETLSLQTRLTEEALASPSKPAELAHLNDQQVNQLAEGG